MTRKQFFDEYAVKYGFGYAVQALEIRDKYFPKDLEDIDELLKDSDFISKAFNNPYCEKAFVVAPKDAADEVINLFVNKKS